MGQRVESKGLRRELHSIQSACTEIQNLNHKRYGGRGEHKGGGRQSHPGFPPHWDAKSQDASREVPREAGWFGQGVLRSNQGRPAIVFACVIDGTSAVNHPMGFCKFSDFLGVFDVFWTAL